MGNITLSEVQTQKIRIIILGPLPPPIGGMEVMTQTLLTGLNKIENLSFRHINTQVSRSLAEKGGKHQIRKSWSGFIQAGKLVSLLISFRPDVVYLPLTNSPSFLGFLRDALFIVPALLFKKKVVIRLNGGYYFYVHRTGLQQKVVRLILGKVSLALVVSQISYSK